MMPLMIILDSYLNYLSLAAGLCLYDYIYSHVSNIIKVKVRRHEFATRRIVFCNFVRTLGLQETDNFFLLFGV
jgi:hypothetical protein